jgi:hypothetical protein
LLDKFGHHHLSSQEDALDINVKHSLPLILGYFGGGLSPSQLFIFPQIHLITQDSYLVPIASSGIIHQNIQSSVLREGQINNGCPVGLLCNIHALELEVAGILRSDLLASLDVDVCDKHLGAFFAKSTSDRSAKARSTSYKDKDIMLVQERL